MRLQKIVLAKHCVRDLRGNPLWILQEDGWSESVKYQWPHRRCLKVAADGLYARLAACQEKALWEKRPLSQKMWKRLPLKKLAIFGGNNPENRTEYYEYPYMDT